MWQSGTCLVPWVPDYKGIPLYLIWWHILPYLTHTIFLGFAQKTLKLTDTFQTLVDILATPRTSPCEHTSTEPQSLHTRLKTYRQVLTAVWYNKTVWKLAEHTNSNAFAHYQVKWKPFKLQRKCNGHEIHVSFIFMTCPTHSSLQ